MPPDGAPENTEAGRVSHLLWEVAAYSAMLSEAALGDTPLTPATAGILAVVAAEPGISIAELARRLPTSAQGVSQLVSKLEGAGYLERRLGERGHGVALFLTAAGESARGEAEKRRSEYEDELVATLGRRSYDQLARLLTRARPLVAEMAARR
jgi:DNA-binding MarR family transcriptional regulator